MQFNLGMGKYGGIISKRQAKSGLSPLGILTLEQTLWEITENNIWRVREENEVGYSEHEKFNNCPWSLISWFP